MERSGTRTTRRSKLWNERHLVRQQLEQDEVAPRFRVRHVPSKEKYLYMDFTEPGKPKVKGI